MKYSNPLPNQEMNEGATGAQIQDFITLGIAFVLVIGFLTLAAAKAGAWFGGFVPYSWERKIAGVTELSFPMEGESEDRTRLRILAADISERLDLNADIDVNVDIADTPQHNAVAFLGGNIALFRGLHDELRTEAAIAFVVAHELGHVKHRHAMKAVGSGLLVSVVMAGIGGDEQSLAGVGQSMAGLILSGYSRDAEREADEAAFAVLQEKYGDTKGAEEVFELFKSLPQNQLMEQFPGYFSTHPLTEDRIAEAKRFSGE